MKEMYIRNFETDDLKRFLDLFSLHMVDSSEKCAHPTGFNDLFTASFVIGKLLRFIRQDIFFGLISSTSNKDVVGAVFARRFPLCKTWIVGPVIVDPKFRHLGIGVGMMRFMLERLERKKAKYLVLSVETDNIQGRKFFEKFNFRYLGPVFKNHDRARKYVQRLALISGYLKGTPFKNHQILAQTNSPQIYREMEKKPIRTWQIMFTELPQMLKKPK